MSRVSSGVPAGLCREEVLARALLYVEEGVNRAGWDRTPQLHAMIGPGTDPNGWTLEALLTKPVFYTGPVHPRDVVRGYVDMLAMPRPGTASQTRSRDFILDGLATGPLQAVLFVAESWNLEVMPGDLPTAPYRGLADHPDAFEARTVVAVAPDATFYKVSRRRGHPPYAVWVNHVTGEGGQIDTTGQCHLCHPGDGAPAMVGGVTRSLRRLVNLVNARAGMPLIPHVKDLCKQCATLLVADSDGNYPPHECGVGG